MGGSVVTKKIKLDDIIEEGFETLVKEKSQVKILVSPKLYKLKEFYN